MKKLIKSFFKFDKSRLIIFLIILLALPMKLYCSSGCCGLLIKPGIFCFSAFTSVTYPMFIFIVLGIIGMVFYGGLTPISFLCHLFFWLIINSAISFVASYPINLIYKRFRKRK